MTVTRPSNLDPFLLSLDVNTVTSSINPTNTASMVNIALNTPMPYHNLPSSIPDTFLTNFNILRANTEIAKNMDATPLKFAVLSPFLVFETFANSITKALISTIVRPIAANAFHIFVVSTEANFAIDLEIIISENAMVPMSFIIFLRTEVFLAKAFASFSLGACLTNSMAITLIAIMNRVSIPAALHDSLMFSDAIILTAIANSTIARPMDIKTLATSDIVVYDCVALCPVKVLAVLTSVFWASCKVLSFADNTVNVIASALIITENTPIVTTPRINPFSGIAAITAIDADNDSIKNAIDFRNSPILLMISAIDLFFIALPRLYMVSPTFSITYCTGASNDFIP